MLSPAARVEQRPGILDSPFLPFPPFLPARGPSLARHAGNETRRDFRRASHVPGARVAARGAARAPRQIEMHGVLRENSVPRPTARSER